MFTADEAADAIGKAERDRQKSGERRAWKKRRERFLDENDVADMAEQVGVSGTDARRYLPPRRGHQARAAWPAVAWPYFRLVVTNWLRLLELAFWGFVLYSMAHLAWHMLTR